jgi:hypothetical protein
LRRGSAGIQAAVSAGLGVSILPGVTIGEDTIQPSALAPASRTAFGPRTPSQMPMSWAGFGAGRTDGAW